MFLNWHLVIYIYLSCVSKDVQSHWLLVNAIFVQPLHFKAFSNLSSLDIQIFVPLKIIGAVFKFLFSVAQIIVLFLWAGANNVQSNISK